MEHSTLNPTIVVKNTVRPKQQLYKMAQTSLAFKITNDVIQRSKNIRISNADASKSVYEALYEHEGLKEAGVRDWPDEFQTEVNEGLRENQFVFMDQKDEQALKVLSQEDMKVTSVKQLLESLAIPEEAKGDRISVVLRCKKVTSAPKVVASAPAAAAPTAAAFISSSGISCCSNNRCRSSSSGGISSSRSGRSSISSSSISSSSGSKCHQCGTTRPATYVLAACAEQGSLFVHHFFLLCLLRDMHLGSKVQKTVYGSRRCLWREGVRRSVVGPVGEDLRKRSLPH